MIELLKNTSWFSDEQVMQVIRFVKPRGTKNATVTVRNLMPRARSGKRYVSLNMSYFNGFARPEIRPAEVVVRVGPSFFFPSEVTEAHGAYLPVPRLRTRTEALVYVMAHELRHVWQAQNRKARRLCGKHRLHCSLCETDADLYAQRQLRRWRTRGK